MGKTAWSGVVDEVEEGGFGDGVECRRCVYYCAWEGFERVGPGLFRGEGRAVADVAEDVEDEVVHFVGEVEGRGPALGAFEGEEFVPSVDVVLHEVGG